MKAAVAKIALYLCIFVAVVQALPASIRPSAPFELEVRHEPEISDFDRRGFDDIADDLDTREETDLFDLEARRMGGIADAAEAVIGVVNAIKGQIQRDKNARSQFTHALVGKMHQKNPKFNYVVCHTKHKTAFDGKRGKDWGHSHQEFDIKLGGTIGYEIYWFKSGKFTRKGDGGYLNWAYYGRVKSKSKNGKVLTFAAP